jgi:NADP-reducing hydrogenase subunit HndC
MKKMTRDDLVQLKESGSRPRQYIRVGLSSCGIAAGAQQIFEILSDEVAKRNLPVEVQRCGCSGMCYAEPLVEVFTEGLPPVVYGNVKPDCAMRIVEDHVRDRRLVNDRIVRMRNAGYANGTAGTKILLVKDTDTASDDKTRDLHNTVLHRVKELGHENAMQVVRAADLGIYNQGFVITALPSNVTYAGVETNDIDSIITAVVQNTQNDKSLLRQYPEQIRIVLRNCGSIDPESIDDYFTVDGYQGITRAIFDMTPETALEEFKKAGLRGRGGAGYPTWMKWSGARNSMGDEKYVICNGDEGDPGAYMDRSVLEGDPHSVIEGMMIAGYIIGAKKGYFYIRAEYPLAIDRVRKAIDQAYERGLLGENILGSNFSFDLDIRYGAGAFVCGEETALIASIEGKRGTPRPRPPFPSDVGLWDKPTIINNVDTLANVAYIITKGHEGFASIGTDKSKGTKVFALTGKIRNSGLVEVPMGMSLRDIVEKIGGGVGYKKKILAIQTGGPSGGVIPEKHFDTPVSYEHLQALGSIMGSGGMIVMDENDCLVDIAKFYLGFCVDESCGKCAPCRIGGFQMLKVLEKISDGKGQDEDIASLRRIAQAMRRGSLCALGQSAPNPVLSTLTYFEEEYRQHVTDKKCRAGKCSGLLHFEIVDTACKRCRLCVMNCPVNAIKGDREHGYVIDQKLCIKCGRCFEVCKFDAITRR